MRNNFSTSLDKYIPMVYIVTMTRTELKRWRMDNDYSQAHLARCLGVAVMTISRWETGTRTIPVFLHLALRCLELEGGESTKGETKITERRTKK
jgi:transcriptional regulator with XRE-family HTH domain